MEKKWSWQNDLPLYSIETHNIKDWQVAGSTQFDKCLARAQIAPYWAYSAPRQVDKPLFPTLCKVEIREPFGIQCLS